MMGEPHGEPCEPPDPRVWRSDSGDLFRLCPYCDAPQMVLSTRNRRGAPSLWFWVCWHERCRSALGVSDAERAAIESATP